MEKTRIVGLPDGEKTLTIYVTVCTQYRRVTDGRTDRQTDGQADILPRHSPLYAYASRGKNVSETIHDKQWLLYIPLNCAVSVSPMTLIDLQRHLPPTKTLNVFGKCFARVCLSVCSFVCLSVCLLATLLINAFTDLDKMLRVDRGRDMDELINF